jgi:hypothetical protein
MVSENYCVLPAKLLILNGGQRRDRTRRRRPFQGRPDQHVYVIMGRLGSYTTAENAQCVSNAGANRGCGVVGARVITEFVIMPRRPLFGSLLAWRFSAH